MLAWSGRFGGTLLMVSGVLLAVAVSASDRVYIVKKHDTLSRIARSYDVTVQELARYNKLADRDVIYTGQKLRIPSPGEAPSALPSAIDQAIQKARVTRGRWKYVVVHHSGTQMGNPKGMDEYHRNHRHMENGLAYHFVIGNGHGMKDGEIAVGHRWTRQLNGGHLASESLNQVSIGICLVGHFDKAKPTTKQMESLVALVAALQKRCGLPDRAVQTHQQINPVYTRCPGRLFPSTTFSAQLRANP